MTGIYKEINRWGNIQENYYIGEYTKKLIYGWNIQGN